MTQKKEGFFMKKYDYLIVGAGLFGSVFAHEADEMRQNLPCDR